MQLRDVAVSLCSLISSTNIYYHLQDESYEKGDAINIALSKATIVLVPGRKQTINIIP